MMGYSFISYSRKDEDVAKKLATELKANDINIWYDQIDISPGVNWDESVEQALKNCDTLIVLLSGNSVKSRNVLDEISYALEENKPIIPIKISECEIPFRIRRLHYFDFTKNYNAGTENLIRKMKPGTEKVIINIKKPVLPLHKRIRKLWPWAFGIILSAIVILIAIKEINPGGKETNKIVNTSDTTQQAKLNEISAKPDTETNNMKIDTTQNKRKVIVRITGHNGLFQCHLNIRSEGALVDSYDFSNSDQLALYLEPGKYLFSFSGIINSGASVTIDIQGEGIHTVPDFPFSIKNPQIINFLADVTIDRLS